MDLLSDKETVDKFKINLANNTRYCSSFMVMKTFSLRKNGSRQRRCGCDETVDRKRVQRKDWMSAETLRKIQERRKKKAILNTCM